MRFFLMHRHDAHTEAGLPPPPELVAQMGAFIGGLAQTGRLFDGAGLGASKTRTRLTFREGRATVKHGPYTGHHEIPARVLLLEVTTRDEAVRWAERYGAILGDGELELGKVTEPWDLGLAPEPPNAPLHLLLIEKASPATEGAGRSPAQKAALARLEAEMTQAGVLQRTHTLRPTREAKRLVFANHRLTTTDGPFTEAKELLGGFAVVELADFDEAVAFTEQYAAILGGTLECDLRVVDLADAP